MKLLITGGSGQLGTELVRQLKQGYSVLGNIPEILMGAEILSPSRKELDICDKDAVTEYISLNKPDTVIHCAAMSDVEGCEDAYELCGLVNGTAVSYIASACDAVRAKLVFLSSDYVFLGDKGEAYLPDDLCAPLSAYGRGKRLGEINALKNCSRTFVVRTSWLYGFTGKNFVRTILRKAASGGEIKVVNDQCGSPTNAEDLAFHIFKLAVTEDYGIYHCTGKGVCSWYDFAKEIVTLSGKKCSVLPCLSSEYKQKAKRPSCSSLDNGTLDKAVGNEMRFWKDALNDYIQRLEDFF